MVSKLNFTFAITDNFIIIIIIPLLHVFIVQHTKRGIVNIFLLVETLFYIAHDVFQGGGG